MRLIPLAFNDILYTIKLFAADFSVFLRVLDRCWMVFLLCSLAKRLDYHNLSEKTVDVGSNVELGCRTTLTPPITYSWSKLEGPVPRTTLIRGSKMIIGEVRASHAGTYVCKANNSESTEHISSALMVTRVLPYFAQAPLSYIEMDTLPDAYLSFDIEVSFRPESLTGLIMYNGARRVNQNQKRGDFVAFGLREGFPEFRFDLGSGAVEITADEPLEVGKWYTVKIGRSRKNGSLTVVGKGTYKGTAPGRLQGLDLSSSFYLGSVPDSIPVSPQQTRFKKGFVGCISRFVIGGVGQQISPGLVKKSIGLTECETCAMNPCENGALCQEMDTVNGFSCLCKPGFRGKACEKTGSSCSPGICNLGRCRDTQKGYKCQCSYGKGGLHCQSDLTITKPAFNGDSYVAFPKPKQILRVLNIKFRFKPYSLDDGVMLYCAQSNEGVGDFASVAVRNGYLEFRFDTGSGPAVLKSKSRLRVDEWHTVSISRKLRDGQMKLSPGGDDIIKGKSPGNTRGLNIRTPIYFGGFNLDDHILAEGVGVSKNFKGCISDVKIGRKLVDISKSAIDSSNINDCSSFSSACESSPCKNGGKCLTDISLNGGFRCECENGFMGHDCGDELNLCDILTPCRNGGTCKANIADYSCQCPLGFAGDNCEQIFDSSSSIGFEQNGFLTFSCPAGRP